jgi:translation initiation factor 6
LALAQMDVGGNPYIGIFCSANEELAFVPIELEKRFRQKLIDTLEVELIEAIVARSSLIGSLMAMNSHGAIVNNFVEQGEIIKLKKYINITVLDEKLNAIGNNILSNDKAALVHPEFKKSTISEIENVLDVEVQKGTVAGLRTVGTAAEITNKGGLVHPKVKDEELKLMEDLFKVKISTGTANYGTPLIGACLIANSNGAVTGTSTTGIELGRIEDGLDLI